VSGAMDDLARGLGYGLMAAGGIYLGAWAWYRVLVALHRLWGRAAHPTDRSESDGV